MGTPFGIVVDIGAANSSCDAGTTPESRLVELGVEFDCRVCVGDPFAGLAVGLVPVGGRLFLVAGLLGFKNSC